MKRNLYIILLVLGINSLNAQNYYFDSVIIGKYYGVIYQHDMSDSTLVSICNNDTMTIDESIYPQDSFLHSYENCKGSQGDGITKYFSDTSFIRLPASCNCFNGKYYTFNDSLRLRFFWWGYNDRFFRFFGRKYWSPVTGTVTLLPELLKNKLFELYPNPAAAKVSIVFSDGYLPYNRQGEVLDLDGRKVMVFEFSTNGSSAVVDVSELKQGVYIIKVNDHERAITKRLVVIK